MPHLDAKALTDDPQGMEFLAKVVGIQCDLPVPAARIDIPDETITLHGGLPTSAELPASRRRRRKAGALVPEAA